VAGALGDATANLLNVPFDVVAQRLQLGDKRYRNGPDAFVQIFRSDGVRGLYRGFGATLLRDTPASAIWWGVYEWLKKVFNRIEKRSRSGSTTATTTRSQTPASQAPVDPVTLDVHGIPHQALPTHIGHTHHDGEVSFWRQQNRLAQMVAGFLASAVTTITLNPIDVAKTRLQTETSKERNVFGVLREIYRQEGTRSFTRGIMPKVMLIAPFSAFSSVIYEVTMQASMKQSSSPPQH
jgi:hypothetical protein